MDGSFGQDYHSVDWIIQRQTVSEQVIVVAGTAPKPLINPVQPNELRQPALGTYHGWWAPLLDDATHLRSSEYQAYSILTMCRALNTPQRGTIASKPAAAR